MTLQSLILHADHLNFFCLFLFYGLNLYLLHDFFFWEEEGVVIIFLRACFSVPGLLLFVSYH